MKLYCLCVDSDNYFAPLSLGPDKESITALVLSEPMTFEEAGIPQVIENKSEGKITYHKHYPNVDLFECKRCGVKIVRE